MPTDDPPPAPPSIKWSTPRTDKLLEEIRADAKKGGCIPKEFARELERENALLLRKYRTAFDGLTRTFAKCDWKIARDAAQKCIDMDDGAKPGQEP